MLAPFNDSERQFQVKCIDLSLSEKNKCPFQHLAALIEITKIVATHFISLISEGLKQIGEFAGYHLIIMFVASSLKGLEKLVEAYLVFSEGKAQDLYNIW